MDPVSLVVVALAAGAATGLTDATAAAINDGYQALKAWILDKYPDAPAAALEKKPTSLERRAALDDLLRDEDAASDDELVKLATALLKAVEQAQPSAAETVGVDFKKVWADSIDVEGVKASGGSTAIRATEVTARSMRFKDVETRGEDPDHP